MLNFQVFRSEDTLLIGKKLGELLEPSMVVCLSGDLGAGKTHLTKGIAAGLGVVDYVTSPTYTLINEYVGVRPLYHFDVYRLESSDELNELGYSEYFYGDGVTVIEWADIILEALPKNRLWIILHKGVGDERRILIDSVGSDYSELLARLSETEELKPLIFKGGVKNENISS